MKRSLFSYSVLLFALTPLLPACDGSETSGSGTTTTETTPVRPLDPAQNDAAYVVTGAPRYLLAGDGLTPPTAMFDVRVTPPAGVTEVDVWIDADTVLPLVQEGADLVAHVPATDLAEGSHTLLLSEHDAKTGFFKSDFVKGQALYVIISTDWDFPDVDDRVLTNHEDLHAAHPELKITHLIGPYTYTDPAVTQERRDLITSWAKGMRDSHGDEIGLHIHPRCTFVEAAGLSCKTQPSVQDPAGDATGYTVHLGAYTREEWGTMFAKSDDIWDGLGFGKPVSFRAGAWTLETQVAEALADDGFVVDSSPVNWAYLEEWEGYELFDWNKQAWGPIGNTSQPYYPTEDSLVPGGSGAKIELLEVPDNGAMVDYWTVAQMQKVFDDNWSGQALTVPTQVSTGFHPAPTEYYSKAEYTRLDQFFTYVDQFLASKTAGPVVYIRMSDAVKVW
ncbi:MAG: hypothetical protein U0441_06875 [Polyangiaceae bacterium]